MDERQFDDLARRIATKTSRRQILKVIAGAVGGMFLGRSAAVDPANAAPGPKCLKEGALCFSSCPPFIPCPQCCPGLTCSGGLISACVCDSGVHCRPVGGGQAQCCPNTDPNNACMNLNTQYCADGRSGGGCLFNLPVPNGSTCPGGTCQNGQCVPSGACTPEQNGQPCGTSPSGTTCLYYSATIGFDSAGAQELTCVCTQGYQYPGSTPHCDFAYYPNGGCQPGWHCFGSSYGFFCAPDCGTSL
jgi:hypothetical protein